MITEHDEWTIVRRFSEGIDWSEINTVYVLVRILDQLKVEQEMAKEKEQKEEFKDDSK